MFTSHFVSFGSHLLDSNPIRKFIDFFEFYRIATVKSCSHATSATSFNTDNLHRWCHIFDISRNTRDETTTTYWNQDAIKGNTLLLSLLINFVSNCSLTRLDIIIVEWSNESHAFRLGIFLCCLSRSIKGISHQFDCYKLTTKETYLTNFLVRRGYWHKDGCRNLHLITSISNPLSMVSG